jgi:hypothetical protein
MGLPLETWALGAIMALVGLLVTACGLGKSELGISFTIAGISSTSVGALIFIVKFMNWIEHF